MLNINKTKNSMACVFKYYEVKIKMVQKQRLQLKMKVLLDYNMKIVMGYGNCYGFKIPVLVSDGI